MSAQTLHDDVDFVFCPQTPAEDELHRIAITMEGVNRPVPTSLFALSVEDAPRLCDRLNRRLGHRDRRSWTCHQFWPIRPNLQWPVGAEGNQKWSLHGGMRLTRS